MHASRPKQGNLRGGSCGRVPSLNTRETKTPTPSNTLRRIPHATAEPRAERGPPMRHVRMYNQIRQLCQRVLCSCRYSDLCFFHRMNGVIVLTSCCQTSTSQEARYDRIPHILFLSPALHGAVKSREHASPDAKITACYGGSSFDDRHGPYKPVTLKRAMRNGPAKVAVDIPWGSFGHP